MAYQRGWSVAFTVDAAKGTLTLVFSVAVSSATGPSGSRSLSTVSHTAPSSHYLLGWVNLVVVYDGADLALYVNGTRVASAAACAPSQAASPGKCGDIAYPSLSDPLSRGATPLVLGAYHNAHSQVCS